MIDTAKVLGYFYLDVALSHYVVIFPIFGMCAIPFAVLQSIVPL